MKGPQFGRPGYIVTVVVTISNEGLRLLQRAYEAAAITSSFPLTQS